MKALAGVAREAFQSWYAGANVPQQSDYRLDATFASWREQSGEVKPIVALTGGVNDLIVIDNPTHRGPFEAAAFDTAVFLSGRPTLIVSEQLPDDLLHHVVIALIGSLEGARVVGQSIVLLHEAERVSIITIPSEHERETGIADLRHYLHWHGVVAEHAVLVTETSGTVGKKNLASCKSIGLTKRRSGCQAAMTLIGNRDEVVLALQRQKAWRHSPPSLAP